MTQATTLSDKPNHSTLSISRALITALMFLGSLFTILLISSNSPFGVTFAAPAPITLQPVHTELASHQETYKYKREFIGQVDANQTSQAGFEVAGLLKHIAVDESDYVKAGQLLAELNSDRLLAQRSEALARVQQAEADAKLAAITYERVHQIRQANAVSAQAKDEAREVRDTSAAAVALTKASLARVEVDIEKTKLYAPFDGVVIHRLYDQGSVVNPGQSVLVIQDQLKQKIRVGVSTRFAEQLSIGDSQQVVVNNEPINAVIKAIPPVKGVTRTIDVILELDNPTDPLKPGETVRLPFDFEVEQRGFWIPTTALIEGKRGLWSLFTAIPPVSSNQADLDTPPIYSVERRTVQVHHTGNDRAYISGAVGEDDRIVIAGASKLVPEQKVVLLEGNAHAQR